MTDLSRHAEEGAEEWQETAEVAVQHWGEQDIVTLLLAAQEELGELTQATLQYQNEGEDYGNLIYELRDLGAVLIQLRAAISAHRFDESNQEATADD